MPEMKDEDLQALDRELSQLLAVEPSPEFATKVRLRIQQEPARGLGWQWWAMGTVGAAAIVAIALAAATRELVQPPAGVHADVSLPAPRVDEPRRQAPAHPVRDRTVRTPNHADAPQFEIVIDPALAAAVRRLAAEPPHLPEVPPQPSLDPVVVEPLKLPDIADAGTKQGDRQ
jgi:hypothetical protein